MWRPIDTAPLDGTSVLLFEDFEPDICRGYFDAKDREWRRNSTHPFFRQPTHWMPLPADPE